MGPGSTYIAALVQALPLVVDSVAAYVLSDVQRVVPESQINGPHPHVPVLGTSSGIV